MQLIPNQQYFQYPFDESTGYTLPYPHTQQVSYYEAGQCNQYPQNDYSAENLSQSQTEQSTDVSSK